VDSGDLQLSLFGEPAPDPVNVDEGWLAAPSEESIGLRLGTDQIGSLHGHQLGDLHQEWLEAEGVRKASGSFYTPPDVVEHLIDLALEPLLTERERQGISSVLSIRVIDPACGSGNFLVAAARRISSKLVSLGMSEAGANASAFGRCVVGVDIDAHAVDICRYLLLREAGGAILPPDAERQVLVADSLAMPMLPTAGLFDEISDTSNWTAVLESVAAASGFDLIIGNPPFLNQLESATSNDRAYADRLRTRFGSSAAGYVDPSALFLLLGLELATPDGGVVCLIEPTSFLSARDAGGVRRSALSVAGLEMIWVAEDRVFDAAVDVCAPKLVRGRAVATTELFRGRVFESAGVTRQPDASEPSWSSLLASLKGLPCRDLVTHGTLRDIAAATADFRDQYYGLALHVLDQASADERTMPRLITAGLIDPATLLWGTRATKFNKVNYLHPRIPLDRLEGKLRSWADQRLVPKVLLATQTKVLEVVVDRDGTLLPSVPVISVTADPDDLWRIAALLSCPPVTLIAAQRHLGAALSADALKLSAKDVLELPLPADNATWTLAAEAFERASIEASASRRRRLLVECGELMCAAFGMPGDSVLLDWWTSRLPGVRDES
jgi:hypothetical protein